LSVDYPDRALNRATTAFRIFLIIPIAIVLTSIGGYSSGGNAATGEGTTVIAIGGTGLLLLPPLLMILFRQKHPRCSYATPNAPRCCTSGSPSSPGCS
jgi:hypothetical protein